MPVKETMMYRREVIGRCPDCGAAVAIVIRPGLPSDIAPHGCPTRACEYPRCRVTRLMNEMVQVHAGTWHCPVHGLLLFAKHLVALYWNAGEADWARIAEIIGEIIPDLINKIEASAPPEEPSRV